MSHRARPRRLDDRMEDPRFLTREDCLDLFSRIKKFMPPLVKSGADLVSQWFGEIRWARNDTVVASDRRETNVNLGGVKLNQTDDASLRAALAWMEKSLYVYRNSPYVREEEADPITLPVFLDTPIWSETTYQQTPEQRNEITQTLLASARQAGMLSAGYLAVEGRATSLSIPGADLVYGRQTIAQCSLTVRDPEGSGAGWAGASSYDWARFDPKKLGEIALDKCLRSRHPVAIEPGRYTVILEPQATWSLMVMIASTMMRAYAIDGSAGPWFDRGEAVLLDPRQNTPANPKGGWRGIEVSKVGQKILDDRITIRQEPMNPDTGVLPFQGFDAIRPQTWIEKGVLVKLGIDSGTARAEWHENEGSNLSHGSFTMSGGTTSVEEMIKSTQRGLLVTRFWGIRGLHPRSFLHTGLTRDGLWLIERGAISKAVKNLRWTDSPLSAFNQVEALGVPVPIFSPGVPAIVPPVKIKEFSFTALVDAV